jgi:hypothetical protein
MEIDPIESQLGSAASPSGANPLSEVPAGEAQARRRGARVAGTDRQAFAQLASVLIGIVAITLYIQLGPRAPIKRHAHEAEAAKVLPVQAEPIQEADTGAAPTEPSAVVPKDVAAPVPSPAPAPVVDQVAVNAAEAALDAASRDRARADHRAAELSRRLAIAASQAALDAAKARKLAFVVRDPSTRIAQASARGGFVRGERDKLEKELSSLKQLPRPKSVSILSKSPVARPASSDEFHFELQHNRISFINLNRLLELTKADAQVRIRMGDRQGVISSKVGPVGSFSLAYELARAAPNSVEELIERKSLRFDLRSWEMVPESENRGETYESIKNPISEFSRAISLMNPARATVTLWVYPDSFSLYRRLREDLTELGFSVAARPLPEGMSIRGSPMGTQSAAQ